MVSLVLCWQLASRGQASPTWTHLPVRVQDVFSAGAAPVPQVLFCELRKVFRHGSKADVRPQDTETGIGAAPHLLQVLGPAGVLQSQPLVHHLQSRHHPLRFWPPVPADPEVRLHCGNYLLDASASAVCVRFCVVSRLPQLGHLLLREEQEGSWNRDGHLRSSSPIKFNQSDPIKFNNQFQSKSFRSNQIQPISSNHIQ